MDFKDSVVVSAGIIGAVTGIIGAITGVIALVHGWYLKRRVFWEPYFRRKWPLVSVHINRYLSEINKYVGQVEQDINQNNPEKLQIEIHTEKPRLDTINWTYAKKAKEKISKTINLVEVIQALSKEYNDLRYLTSQRLNLDIYLQDVQEYMHVDNPDWKQESDIELSEIRFKRSEKDELITGIAKQYGVTRLSEFSKLSNNPVYKNDLLVLRADITRHIGQIQLLLKEAEAEIDFLDTNFSDET